MLPLPAEIFETREFFKVSMTNPNENSEATLKTYEAFIYIST
jgi:hypothetical protein